MFVYEVLTDILLPKLSVLFSTITIRKSHKLKTSIPLTELFKSSLKYSSTVIWNSIPSELHQVKFSLCQFQTSLLNIYTTIVDCFWGLPYKVVLLYSEEIFVFVYFCNSPISYIFSDFLLVLLCLFSRNVENLALFLFGVRGLDVKSIGLGFSMTLVNKALLVVICYKKTKKK